MMLHKPWMQKRPGETESQRITRLNRTCFHCGHRFATVAKCDEHEISCPKAPGA